MACNTVEILIDTVAEFLEPYSDMESADLFAKLPGEEAQRVVRARAVFRKAQGPVAGGDVGQPGKSP